MHQRDAVRAAWAAAGLDQLPDPGLQQFLKTFDAAGEDCWPQLAERARKLCPGQVERLAAAIWRSGDPLLRVNLIRQVDLSSKAEAALMERWARTLDVDRHRCELAAVVERGPAAVLDRVLHRRKLPAGLRAAAGERLARAAGP